MKYVVLVGLGGVLACGHPHAAVDDAAPAADAARPADAFADAAPDAMPDAAADAMPDTMPDVSPACTTAPALLYDTSPRQIDSFALAGGVLYIAAYQEDASQHISDPAVLAIDPSTGMQVAAPFITTGVAHVAASGGAAYVSDANSAGSIWRLVPGQMPAELVTNRPTPGLLAADDTYVYWAEQGSGPADPYVVESLPIAGGTMAPMMVCDSPVSLIVDGGYLYCAELLRGDIQAVATDGSGGGGTIKGTGVGGSYSIVAMTAQAGHVDFANLYAAGPQLWDAPEPAGSATQIAIPSMGRYMGLADTSTYVYVDDNVGLQRIRRSDLATETLYADPGLQGNPIIAGNQLYFAADDPNQSGQRRIMHCVD